MQAAFVIEPGFELREEGMALAGEHHVETAGEAHAHGPAGLPRAEGGDGGVGAGLRLFAAEGSAHAKALHGDLMARDAEHARDNLLGLAGMLCGTVERDAAGFVEPRHRRLGLQVKMLLAADADFSFDAVRAAREGVGRGAALDHQRAGVEAGLR